MKSRGAPLQDEISPLWEARRCRALHPRALPLRKSPVKPTELFKENWTQCLIVVEAFCTGELPPTESLDQTIFRGPATPAQVRGP